MKLILNIRGSNASGKTTAVRQFIQQYPGAQIGIINGSPVTRCAPGIFVLGRYDKKNGGCDMYSGKAEIFKTIDTLVRTYSPELIIYEGMIYSKLVSMAIECKNRYSAYGYEWRGIYLHRSIDKVFEYLETRNNGKNFDSKNIVSTYNGAKSSSKSLIKKGLPLRWVEVDKIPFEQMGNIILDEIRKKP